MTMTEKVQSLKLILDPSGNDGLLSEGTLVALLNLAKNEILAWRYSYSAKYADITEVPREYETTQIYAVVAGYSQIGAENEVSHSENGISRSFSHSDMLAYIRANVIPIIG